MRICSRSDTPRFNGAADKRRRRGGGGGGAIAGTSGFNGAADKRRRRAAMCTARTTGLSWLQWGRRQTSTERSRAHRWRWWRWAASMGPPTNVDGEGKL